MERALSTQPRYILTSSGTTAAKHPVPLVQLRWSPAMDPYSVCVSEVGETESPGLNPVFLSPGDDAAAQSLGELIQPILLRCAVRLLEAREAASNGSG